MEERRRRRSSSPQEALALLLRAVRDRSEISAIAVVDRGGQVVGGHGPRRELSVLGTVAAKVASGGFDPACARLVAETDVMACSFVVGDETLYLAALGERVRRMPEAARGAARILELA